MKIRLYEVKLTMSNADETRTVERKFVAIGVCESDAMDRVKQYYIDHAMWEGSILKAEAVQHRFDDFAVVSGEVF